MKKNIQLGMNPSTASGRLVKDLLFKFVSEAGHVCFHCGEKMSRDNFSIEHKIPWLDSDNPVQLFFDLNNISFSHLQCNIAMARKPKKRWQTEEERKEIAAIATKTWWHSQPKEKRQSMRKRNYQRNGC